MAANKDTVMMQRKELEAMREPLAAALDIIDKKLQEERAGVSTPAARKGRKPLNPVQLQQVLNRSADRFKPKA